MCLQNLPEVVTCFSQAWIKPRTVTDPNSTELETENNINK